MEASKTTQITNFSLIVILFALSHACISWAMPTRRPAANNLTTRNSDYTKPMYFDVLGGPDMPVPFVDYEMQEKGSQLRLGPVVINEKTFSFGLRRLGDIDSAWTGSNETYFFIKWPELLFPEVSLELLTRDGVTFWKRELKKDDLKSWIKKAHRNLKNLRGPVAQINWAIEFNGANIPIEGLSDGFKFCLSRLQENAIEKLCSQTYVTRRSGKQVLLGRLKEATSPRILINAEQAPDVGQVKSEGGVPVRFFSELSTGETLEFTSRPRKISWSDFSQLEGKDLYTIVGFDTPPAGAYKNINTSRDAQWLQSIGFESTIADPRKFWAIQIKTDQPWLYFPGETGGIFRYPLPTDHVPSSRLRLHLDKQTPVGTYRDGVKLHGRKQPTSVVSSQERRVLANSNSEEFTWSFKAAQDAKINRSSVLISDGGKTYRAYYELYKGYSNELSTRLSTIMSSSGLILMGEAAYNVWFEDFLGWDNYYLTKQRWGLSGKYFQSITKYTVKGVGQAELKVLNADLKYRFTPGLWTRDETQGMMLSYQSFDAELGITSFKVPMTGVGWFWARSMPKAVDDIFNIIPFMNYPKWVDMEFIYYAASSDSTKKLNIDFALNFHGQVLWKDNFFGEAGFGIKRYDFVDKTNAYQSNLGYTLNTLYGTLGVGLKF
jgi:hypothetical protein